MHARLTFNQRNKIETDIASLVASLNEAISCGDNQISELEQSLEAEKSALTDANAELDRIRDENQELKSVLSDFEITDAELRERIITLEQSLVTERQRAGQELMSRILELESMLEVERRRVEDMPEMTSMTTVTTRASAANTATKLKRTKKTG